jgi:HK97 family phage major capsid protein
MAQTSKALREKRLPLAKTIRQMSDKLHAEGRTDFSPEEQTSWLAVNKDYDALTRQIEIAERAEKVDADQGTGGPGRDDNDTSGGKRRRKGTDGADTPVTEEMRALAIQAWLRRQHGKDLGKRHIQAAKACGLQLGRKTLPLGLSRDYAAVRRECRMAAWMKSAESRTLSSQLPTAGGYLVPQGFMNAFETALLAYANVREVAEVIRTESGNELPWPTSNDTSNSGALLAEATAAATNVDPTMGQMVLRAYKYTSRIVLVPYELMNDSAINLVVWLGDLLGTRLGRAQAPHFTTGDGASKPRGIVTAATLGVTAASATAITFDEIFNLKHSVDPAYRMGAGWMLHDSVLLYVRKLKDGQGRYLWSSGTATGAPDTIDGDPLTINQSMASSVATTNKTILFGQLSKYKIRDVGEIRMRRLDERYADSDSVGFVAFQRCDGNLLDAGVAPVKYLQQA